jgi:hypothetical protein
MGRWDRQAQAIDFRRSACPGASNSPYFLIGIEPKQERCGLDFTTTDESDSAPPILCLLQNQQSCERLCLQQPRYRESMDV